MHLTLQQKVIPIHWKTDWLF